jgi:tRNA1(Val) A37 N6-methylase TrmN6
MKSTLFRNAVELSHLVVSQAVAPCDTVIDATCGNGYDTLFLARLVSPGKVFAFDITARAIDNTLTLLTRHGFAENLSLHQSSFISLADYVNQPVKAIMFNLGYLPGGDRDTATTAEETELAVSRALNLLVVGGVMTIVYYTGHDGGEQEADRIINLVSGLSQQEFEVVGMKFMNQVNNPPGLVIINRIKEA